LHTYSWTQSAKGHAKQNNRPMQLMRHTAVTAVRLSYHHLTPAELAFW